MSVQLLSYISCYSVWLTFAVVGVVLISLILVRNIFVETIGSIFEAVFKEKTLLHCTITLRENIYI